MEATYRQHQKAMDKKMCKHCKSMAHSTLQHGKHYKGFKEEKNEARMKHYKAMFEGSARDNDRGVKEGSKADEKRDRMEDKHKKGLPNLTTKHTGKFEGKSNALGHGGRAAQLRARGVPGGVIGKLAREAHAAPGQANYHGKHKKAFSDPEMGKMPNVKNTGLNIRPPKTGLYDNSHAVGGSGFGGKTNGGKFAKKRPKA